MSDLGPTWSGTAAVVAVCALGWRAAGRLGARDAASRLVAAAVLAAITLVAIGHALSVCAQVNRPAWWALGTVPLVWLLPRAASRLAPLDLRVLADAPVRLAAPCLMLVATAAMVCLLQAAVVVFTAPHVWDAMTYHLARVAYYVQAGTFESYPANYWAQVAHPLNSAILHTFALIATGNENLTQGIQYVAWVVASAAIYRTARLLGATAAASLGGALCFALLTESLMEATTTQNDMLIAACCAAAMMFLVEFAAGAGVGALALAAGAACLGAGMKATGLLAWPSLGVVLLWALRRRRWEPGGWPGARGWAIAAALGCVIALVPAGYVRNYREGHTLFGPAEVLQRHVGSMSVRGRAVDGLKNVLRHGTELVSLDGLPPVPVVIAAQSALRFPLEASLRAAGVSLDEPTRTFRTHRRPIAHEDASYWGPLGFLLLAGMLLSFVRPRWRSWRVCAVAALVWLGLLCWTKRYDAFDNRYFLTMAALAAPLAAPLFDTRRRWVAAAVSAVVCVGCAGAICAVVLRSHSPLVSVTFGDRSLQSVFARDRIGQLMRNRPGYEPVVRRFEEVVPEAAVVAVCLPADQYEYPLFGRRLRRRLVAVSSLGRSEPRVLEIRYLLSTPTTCGIDPGDVWLGEDWWVRHPAP